MQENKQFKLLMLGLHVFLGILFVYTPKSTHKVFGGVIFLIGLLYIYKTKNKSEEAMLFAFYFMSAEVFLRMTKSTLTWDFGKYAVILYLLLALFIEKKKRGISVLFILYLLLISIGIAYTDIPLSASYRKAILFNITGPYCLGVCAMYFYKRDISFDLLKKTMWIGILPVISMVVYLYFRTPSIKEIVFNSAANFEASGGFGPNQVATSLGFGIFLIGVLILLKYKITGYLTLDYLLLFYVVYRGLLTFSRGGIFTGIISFIILLIFYLLNSRNKKLIVTYLVIFCSATYIAWLVIVGLTGGMLANRYLGKNSVGEEKEDISSGRTAIIEDQLTNFYDSPLLGIGVASGDYRRKEKYEGTVMSTSHNEVTRLIEEHGLIGILSLMLLITASFLNFREHSLLHKGFIAAFALLWFLTINHSGMRVAFPGFIYGLSLIKIRANE
ncbi:O-antigen ligase family protein [Wenyingzhuangia sp. IMCC45533]